jgi:hypothetical protein
MGADAEAELERQMQMVQLRKRFEKAENDKAMNAEKLRALGKDYRGVVRQRDEERGRANAADAEKEAMGAELADLRASEREIMQGLPPTPARAPQADTVRLPLGCIPGLSLDNEEEEHLVVRAAVHQSLFDKYSALSTYTKRKNLEVRRLMFHIMTLKNKMAAAGGGTAAVEAAEAEAEAHFDLKTELKRVHTQLDHATAAHNEAQSRVRDLEASLAEQR